MLSRFSRAFLNRERILGSTRIQIDKEFDCYVELNKSALEKDRDWHIDNASSSVYKGKMSFSAKTGHDDEEVDNTTESILLSDGNSCSKAEEAEHASEMLASLQGGRSSLQRLYFLREHADRIKEMGFKVKSRKDVS